MKTIEELKNTVLQGDCLELMKDIPDKSIDMILCDLPYGTTACKWDTIIPFEPLWEQYKRIIKDNGAIVLTASQPFTSALVMSNLKMFKYCWVWEKSTKTNFLNAKVQPLRKHEDILVFGKSKVNYFPQGLEDKNSFTKQGKKETENYHSQDRSSGGYFQEKTGYPHDIIFVKSESSIYVKHPTQKPVALFEYLIKTYTNEGDIVLDNCAGSFTTAIASENTKRNWICIEQLEEYCEIGKKRIEENRKKLST